MIMSKMSNMSDGLEAVLQINSSIVGSLKYNLCL